jgi:septal ring factor EnvC (AmiA/AmiB activator)
MRQKYYYCVLFALVAALVYIFHRKIEHLTVEEVDDKTAKAVDRITKLEDEYSSIHATLTSQEERMKAATSQATEAQAFLNTPID